MIEKILSEAVAAAPGRTAAMLCELESGRTLYEYNATVVMPSASTIKVAIMAEAMRRAETEGPGLDTQIAVPPEEKLEDSIIGLLEADSFSLADLTTLMIIMSDNTATNVLIKLLGMENINAYASGLGLAATVVRRKMLDFEAARRGLDNTTTAADLAGLFGLIGNGKLPGSARMLDILIHQKQGAFRRRLSDDVKIAHKPGGLATLAHDAGIFFLPTGNYVFCLLADGAPNPACQEYIGETTFKLYDELTKGV
ncbi:MAG: serine hydrolase [Victivallaceae bacterium]|nr:serine hydrolase [Victivallaceae bacterium]